MDRRLSKGTLATVGAMAILAGSLAADPVLRAIDIRPVIGRHPMCGNSLGLAYNPVADVIYLSHGSAPHCGVIYVLDLEGQVLSEVNWQSIYRPQAYPTSLSYDTESGHLFVDSYGIEDGIHKIVEVAPNGFTIIGVSPALPLGGGGGIIVRSDGIWLSQFGYDSIRRYSRDGHFIEQVSVAASFPGFPGPGDLTSSFTGGFFINDPFQSRVVEVDKHGHQVAEGSVSLPGGGIYLAIDADQATRRIFVQVSNQWIYLLSSDFFDKPTQEPRASWGDVKVHYR